MKLDLISKIIKIFAMDESLIDKESKKCKCESTTKLAIIFLSGAMLIILSIVIALIIVKPQIHTKSPPKFSVKYYSMLNNIQDNVSLEEPYIKCPEETIIYPNELKVFPSINGTACANIICSRDSNGIVNARINYDGIDRYIHDITQQENTRACECSLVHYIAPVNRYSVNVTGYCCDIC